MLVLVVHAASPGHEETWDPFGRTYLPDALMMSLGFSALWSHADVSGLFNHLRPC